MKKPTQFRDPELETSGSIIGFYPREFYMLDNFSSFQVDWKGRRWPTVEHAYQAAHFFDTAPDIAEAIAQARSAHDAFKLARKYADKAPANWSEVKVGIMEDICRHKLQQNQYVYDKLLLTGDMEIIEDSTKDSFWGWGPDRKGENQLGKIWMRLRDEITT